MVEVVRACLRANNLAQVAEFFSFGTNDLTQATFSFSREDAENKFLPLYRDRHILQDNPFEVLDVKGVGRLMGLAVGWGRTTHPTLKVGICGEHGGHPASIRFCDEIGLNYVSCSGPRVPIARLAAAHAQILLERKKQHSAPRASSTRKRLFIGFVYAHLHITPAPPTMAFFPNSCRPTCLILISKPSKTNWLPPAPN